MSANPRPSDTVSEATHMVGILQEAAFAFGRGSRRVSAWNTHATQLLGYGSDEALALSLEDLLGPSAAFTAARAPSGPGRMVLRAKDGSRRAARITFSAVGSGDDGWVLAIARPEATIGTDLFRSVFDRAATGIAVTDLTGRFIECNDAFQNLVGFKQRELKHLSFDALSHPQDRVTASAPYRDLLEGRRDFWEVTKRLIRKDGSIVWIHETISLVRDDAGRPLHCIAVVNDITEERRAEQRSAIQLTISTLLADNPPASMAIVQVMQAICRTLGWQIGEYWAPEGNPGELRRQVSWQVPGFHAAEFNMVGQHVSMSPGEGLPGTVWMEGAPAWIADVLKDGNFLRRRMAEQAGIKGALGFPVSSAKGLLGVMVFAYQDFRHPDDALLAMLAEFGAQLGQFLVRKQAERQLKLLGAIVNSAAAAVVGTDPQGLITSWNPSAERLFGYSSEEALGKPSRMLFPRDQHPSLATLMSEALGGHTSAPVALEALSKQGDRVRVRVMPMHLRDESGSTAGLSMTVTEATKR